MYEVNLKPLEGLKTIATLGLYGLMLRHNAAQAHRPGALNPPQLLRYSFTVRARHR